MLTKRYNERWREDLDDGKRSHRKRVHEIANNANNGELEWQLFEKNEPDGK